MGKFLGDSKDGAARARVGCELGSGRAHRLADNAQPGRGTVGLAVNKSNWANTIDTPPFEAYAVTCGITFTFGGLRINTDAQVVSTDGDPIRGLYAAGELVGGIFYFNYPGGTGLTNGSVFGRLAGANAARFAGAGA